MSDPRSKPLPRSRYQPCAKCGGIVEAYARPQLVEGVWLCDRCQRENQTAGSVQR